MHDGFPRHEAPTIPHHVLRLRQCAAAMDRTADLELARGRHAVAERLARRADELREAGR